MLSISYFLDNFVPILLIVCGLSTLITIIFTFILWRRISNWSSPDIPKLRAQFTTIKTKHPQQSSKKVMQKIVNQQAFKCGMVGAVTSFGGFYTLPIALPVDMILSTQIQATLVEFIASAYGIETNNELENRVRTYIVTTGSTQLSKRTSRIMMKFSLRFFGRSFAKLIPFVGAFIGFATNYMIAQGTARVAIKWYEQQARKQKALPTSTQNSPPNFQNVIE